jgi:hypothetical protein
MRYIYYVLESATLGLHSLQINAKNLKADVISNYVRTKDD